MKAKPFKLSEIDAYKFNQHIPEASLFSCWEWRGMRVRQGYGRFYIRPGHEVRAHRVAYAMSSGEELLPDDVVCHRCDNPPCCNPLHLFKGTAYDNIHDAINKGRFRAPGRSDWTHCKRGHPLSGNNLYYYKPGRPGGPRRKQCKACTLARQKRGDVGHALSKN